MGSVKGSVRHWCKEDPCSKSRNCLKESQGALYQYLEGRRGQGLIP